MTPAQPTLPRRLAAEALGTCLLLAMVVGSGIMGRRLGGGNEALGLLANSLATGFGLVALILTLGPVSGAHFNPVVTLADASTGGLNWREVGPYLLAQGLGAVAGVGLANGLFGEPVFVLSAALRHGAPLLISEGVATFGLLAVILGCSRRRPETTPFAVGAYIAAAYWFTPSTAFANPAATLARVFAGPSAGIRPQDIGGFILAQLLGAGLATRLFAWLVPDPPTTHHALITDHEAE